MLVPTWPHFAPQLRPKIAPKPTQEPSQIDAKSHHIFDRFFRSEDVVAGGIPGTGLGLALVRSTLDAHGADIEVHSETGKGSTFTVTIPLI